MHAKSSAGSSPRLAMILRGAELVLLTVGLLAGAWFVFVQVDAAVANRRDRAELRAMAATAAATHEAHRARQAPAVHRPITAGSLIGALSAERLGLSTIVRQGDSEAILRLGAGHIPGTSLPGEGGNVGIAGHRDTVFRPLRQVHVGDIITLATPAGEKRYRVDWTRTVAPTDISVLAPTNKPSLTLVTCYPFRFIGHAPKRFVVRAVALPEPAARSIF